MDEDFRVMVKVILAFLLGSWMMFYAARATYEAEMELTEARLEWALEQLEYYAPDGG